MREVNVGPASELSDPGRKLIGFDNFEVAVFKVGGEFFAYLNHCPHMGGPACQGKIMATEEDLRGLFLASTGLSAEDFNGAYSGFATDNRVRRGENIVRELGVTSVPTVVVDGRWYTNGTMAGSNDKVFAIVDFLVQQAKADRKLK